MAKMRIMAEQETGEECCLHNNVDEARAEELIDQEWDSHPEYRAIWAEPEELFGIQWEPYEEETGEEIDF